ncbi:signal peptide containing protein [Theileria equi strain WA]|uniref:Signal peptide containing protein n=1 Tax=Theileria equi strain WA TaxID=1537102 RepID=L1LEE4_THEEQ|nr:signal peptide containing protein [Theileria equi strain WA]EKX73625.1 signal peptide containing protein [Theileria equi strain WA]|eukprot:XP_004833077.1 signal peptide containing protein [Theileria equi strain WA]
MKVIALLWTVCLVRLCHGKSGHKNYRGNDNEHSGDSKKSQSIPASPRGSGNAVAEGSGTAEGSSGKKANVNAKGSEDDKKPPTQPNAPVKIDGPTPQKQPQANAQSAGQGDTTLDISDPDSSKVDVGEETSRGIKWKVFKPKDGVTITSFTEGGAEIGKISSAVKLLRIPLHSQTPIIYIAHGGATPEKCYEKVDGKWKEIGLNDFYMRTNEIKNAVKPNEEAVRAEGTSNNPED